MASFAPISYAGHFERRIAKEELGRLAKTQAVTHVSSCTQATHKLSELLLTPTSTFIQAWYRLEQPLPGENKHLLYRKRGKEGPEESTKDKMRWHLLSVSTMALTFIPALAGFALGFPLRLLDQRYRPLVSLINDPTRPLPAPISLQQDHPFHIRSFNLGLTPTSVAISLDMRPPLKRAFELAKSMLSDPHPPSVIMAQEGWNEEASKLLCEKMKTQYPFIIHNVAPQIVGMNGSVMVFSKYPIEDVVFQKLDDMVWKHSFPPRGILRVRLKTIFERRDLLIYGTHTQSCYGEKEAKARIRQLQQIDRMMKRDLHEEPDCFQILMGDLNTTRFNEDGQLAPETETPVLSSLNTHFDDLFLRDHDHNGNRTSGAPHFLDADNERMRTSFEEPRGSWYFGPHSFGMTPKSEWGTSEWSKTQIIAKTRYDYILLPKNSPLDGRVESRRICVSPDAQSAPSDHTPIDARIWLKASSSSSH